ncbi:MAG: hypothetical protein IT385_18275 [Deltaproteobacteria bacterium]|nr:hypothetical protein [Deltaproteobacteria bacterium]
MIQLSIGLVDVAPDALPDVPVPLVRTAMPWGTRVTGVWSGGLGAARGALATWLGAVDPELVVRDLLTGRLGSASETAARLAAPPSVHNVLSARHTILDGRIWARLFGCYALGEADLVVSAELDVDVARVYELLGRWGGFRLEAHAQGAGAAAFDPERPIPYGYWLVGTTGADVADAAFWATLRDRLESAHIKDAFDARMATPSPRVVIEADRVDAPEPGAWLVGASRALRTVAAQRATLERLGLDPSAQARATPHAHDAAGFCDRLDDVSRVDAFFAHREEPQSELDSGWRFGCLDEAHVHDAASLRLAPLYRLTTRHPGLVPYLTLPPGWVVVREDGAWWLRPPGEERAYRDEVPGA